MNTYEVLCAWEERLTRCQAALIVNAENDQDARAAAPERLREVFSLKPEVEVRVRRVRRLSMAEMMQRLMDREKAVLASRSRGLDATMNAGGLA